MRAAAAAAGAGAASAAAGAGSEVPVTASAVVQVRGAVCGGCMRGSHNGGATQLPHREGVAWVPGRHRPYVRSPFAREFTAALRLQPTVKGCTVCRRDACPSAIWPRRLDPYSPHRRLLCSPTHTPHPPRSPGPRPPAAAAGGVRLLGQVRGSGAAGVRAPGRPKRGSALQGGAGAGHAEQVGGRSRDNAPSMAGEARGSEVTAKGGNCVTMPRGLRSSRSAFCQRSGADDVRGCSPRVQGGQTGGRAGGETGRAALQGGASAGDAGQVGGRSDGVTIVRMVAGK